MTSKQQLQLWAYGFGRGAKIEMVRSLGVKQLRDPDGFPRSLQFVTWAFYTGFAGNWCDWQVKTCRSCGVVYAEKPLERCKVKGFHVPSNDRVRYNNTGFGPKMYIVDNDGLRSKETSDLMVAGKARAAAKEKAKHKGVGTL